MPTPPVPLAAATPFPWGAMLVLAVASLAQGMVVFVPEIAYPASVVPGFGMAIGLGASDLGLLGFMAGYYIATDSWFREPDKRGRKLQQQIALVSIGVDSIAFSMSKVLWVALAFRGITGIVSGVAFKSCFRIPEISPLQSYVYAIINAVFYSLGLYLGAHIGGLSVNLGEAYYGGRPATGVWPIMVRYPHLGTSLVIAAVAFTAAVGTLRAAQYD